MLNILQAIGSIGTFIMAILYLVSVMVQIRQIKISFIPFLAFDQIIIEQTDRLKLKNITESDADYVNTAFKLQNLGGGTAKNIDIKVYLDEDELDKFSKNQSDLDVCEKVYISSDILLTSTQESIFKNNNIEVYIIPEYYFEDEIMEVM